MCGIIGIVGHKNVSARIIEGLKRLEYRGYDSAGIATVDKDALSVRRAAGKLGVLAEMLASEPIDGHIGIGHTRWATHGAANTRNAHPHINDEVAIVHNGIIENYAALKTMLENKGAVFSSETDSEVVAHLLAAHLREDDDLSRAAQKTFAALTGTYALAILRAGNMDEILIARRGSPLALGLGDGETYIGSDGFALAPLSNRVIYLEDGDWAIVRADSVAIYDIDGAAVSRPTTIIDAAASMVDKGGFRHFMAKEIHEQPEVLSRCLAQYIAPDSESDRIAFMLPPDMPTLLNFKRVVLVGCGTAFFAAQIGRYLIERITRLPAQCDIASEFRYRDSPVPKNCLAIFISQSGETADTLAALRQARTKGMTCVAIVNVLDSSIARAADAVLPLYAGPEIGVASTKAFTAQIAILIVLCHALAEAHGMLDNPTRTDVCAALRAVPRLFVKAFESESVIRDLAPDLAHCTSALFIGRGMLFPLALEGALKMKELSYVHAEGFAAGELKHGSIALIDEDMPVIVLAHDDSVLDKTLANMNEVLARGAQVILIGTALVLARAPSTIRRIEIPACHSLLAPLLYALPLQLLAYYTACAKGTDIDQPRNLAKSVTVE